MPTVSYTDDTGTYRVDDRIVYDGRLATVTAIVSVTTPTPYVEIETEGGRDDPDGSGYRSQVGRHGAYVSCLRRRRHRGRSVGADPRSRQSRQRHVSVLSWQGSARVVIRTPPNMPRIAAVIKFWPYRHFFDDAKRQANGIEGPLTIMYRGDYGNDSEHKVALDLLRQDLSILSSPERPMNHVDNHSGWEVTLKNGTRAFVLFTDLCCYMYQLPERKTS